MAAALILIRVSRQDFTSAFWTTGNPAGADVAFMADIFIDQGVTI
ncbi:MAG: hypothetical protein AAFS02_04145 [Pseudomonadota bacterium]